MEKQKYIAPIADVIELSADIILLSDEEGWGDMIPVDSRNPGEKGNSSKNDW